MSPSPCPPPSRYHQDNLDLLQNIDLDREVCHLNFESCACRRSMSLRRFTQLAACWCRVPQGPPLSCSFPKHRSHRTARPSPTAGAAPSYRPPSSICPAPSNRSKSSAAGVRRPHPGPRSRATHPPPPHPPPPPPSPPPPRRTPPRRACLRRGAPRAAPRRCTTSRRPSLPIAPPPPRRLTQRLQPARRLAQKRPARRRPRRSAITGFRRRPRRRRAARR